MPFDAANLPLIERAETSYCVVSAAHRYNLPVEALLSILLAEGGKVGTKSKNTDGSTDLGVMQINTVWLKPKSPLYGYVTADTLTNDLCVNIHAAAWIVASNLIKTSGDIWRAIGRYHSPGNSQLAWRYMNRVNDRLGYARKVALGNVFYRQNTLAFFQGVAEPIGETRSAPAFSRRHSDLSGEAFQGMFAR